MIDSGERLVWRRGEKISDKHCVGGLPGNRTTLIVAPILAAAGLTMPKTSSRAITSPAGTPWKRAPFFRGGNISGRLEAEYDQLLTQRLILQPRIDSNSPRRPIPGAEWGAASTTSS